MFWNNWKKLSLMRKRYIVKLIGRCVIFAVCVLAVAMDSPQLDILDGMAFFERFSPLHLLWIVWVAGMIEQLVPVKKKIPLGSQKLFQLRFRPVRERLDRKAVRRYLVTTTKAAYRVMVLWVLLLAALGWLHHQNIIGDRVLFLVSVAFYVCDLICVLIWCPFRLMMKTRCCTTCRIFNWDHLMMFTPMMFVKGFFSQSLVLIAVAVWLVWELFVLLYPERFWEGSNEALKCSACTDKLCTQYCSKLRG